MIVTSYINSKDYTYAVIIIGKLRDNLEWSLCDSAFKELIGVSGAPKIDFFTSRKNRKIKIYVSNTSDLNAFTEDASLVTWDNLKC